jgi:monofunctional biosynthetic peptidoglycan transglycosylase
MSEEAQRKSSSKGLVSKIILSLILVVILVPIVWLFVLSPRSEISKLKDQYVLVKFNGEVSYEVKDKKPKNWVTLKSISSNASNAIVISEDWGFFQHEGVDYSQIKKALEDASAGKKLRGASTISQQLIKNLFLSSERSYLRKLKEFALVSHLENEVSKEKILETYLNIIEFGEGVYGIGAASRHYFNKKPGELTAKEGAFLAMLLPNPKKYSSSFRDKKLTPYAEETINEILHKMAIAGHIKKEKLEELQQRKMNWEEQLEERLDTDTPQDRLNIKPNSKNQKTRPSRNARLKAKMIKPKSYPKTYEERYRNDKDLELDENLEYDDDAILEDTSGLKEEFSVE